MTNPGIERQQPAGGARMSLVGAVLALAAAAALATVLCAPALAAGRTGQAPNRAAQQQTTYQLERADCLGGRSGQDQKTCLREAAAADAEVRRGGLDDGDARYPLNQRKRCDALPDQDRRDCVARMQGAGTTTGSVAGGGVLRELVTRKEVQVIVTQPLPPSSPARPNPPDVATPATPTPITTH